MYRKRLKGYASIGYRIRNNEAFDSLFPITDVIYDGQNFESPFITDLSKARQSVVVSCPKVKIGRHSQIADRLVDLMANGIEIVLYTKEEDDDAIRLQHQGISVIYKDHLSLHAAIIDKSTIWYGSVNILGYHSLEDNLIRFRNPEIASNLLDSLQKSTWATQLWRNMKQQSVFSRVIAVNLVAVGSDCQVPECAMWQWLFTGCYA